jgi:hypothetical protein
LYGVSPAPFPATFRECELHVSKAKLTLRLPPACAAAMASGGRPVEVLLGLARVVSLRLLPNALR